MNFQLLNKLLYVAQTFNDPSETVSNDISYVVIIMMTLIPASLVGFGLFLEKLHKRGLKN